MLELSATLFEELDQTPKLLSALQTALELEHATIPPYLFAAYTLKGVNSAIREFIFDVAREEMLHMTLVGNLINALGGSPRLNSPDFIPKYPSNLPGTVQNDLKVGLAPFSKELLKDVFMRIEEPENPAHFPVVSLTEGEVPRTIGQFYRSIKAIIEAGDGSMFTGDQARQVTTTIDDDESFEIVDKASAIKAIDLIVEQGEGTQQTPLEAGGTKEAAHYYRFEQIFHGRELKEDASVPEGFSYNGAIIPFDPAAVWPAKSNLKTADIPTENAARALSEQFNRDYTAMLNDLHRAFNGEQGRIARAVRTMRLNLKNAAGQLVRLELSPGVNAGPTFEFLSA